MKNLKYTLLCATIFSASVAMTSCSNEQKNDSPTEVAEDMNDAKFSNKKEDDAQFLVDAAVINLDEIQLGKLAQTNGSIADVKELGKMMETEHTQALNELKSLADRKQITVPTTLTDDEQTTYRKLLDKTGNKFDKEYCDKMVEGHKDAIGKFEKASKNASDSEIRAWAEKMLPGLRMHLEHSILCQEKCEKM